MALKDLVADHTKIAEETIEKIISPYIRYDAADHKIIWTPQGHSLGRDAKVLVFLVAALGWRYVADDGWEPPTKPADLEAELGITGGTLRPILKKLKDSHLLAVVNGHYRVQLANLDSVERAIAGEIVQAPSSRKARKSPRKSNDETRVDQAADHLHQESQKRRRGASGGQLKPFLMKWIADGFFNQPKILPNLLRKYHEHGVITKQTSLSGLLLEAVRGGSLSRTKINVGSKEVWAYKAQTR